MKVYGAIFMALLRSSVLMLPLLVLMVVAPLLVQVFGWNFWGARRLAGLMLFLSFCVGGLLGSFSASLMPGQAWQTFPAYASRIMAMCVLTGMAVCMPVFWCIAETNRVTWTGSTALWCYGALGFGFVSGGAALYLRSGVLRWFWLGLVLMVFSWVVPSSFISNTSFSLWGGSPLVAGLSFLSPLGVICLLVGPMSWPLLAWMIAHDRLPPYVDGGSNWLTTVWDGRGDWSLPLIARRIHGHYHPRLEFLVFPSSLLSSWTLAWMPIFVPPIVFLWFLFTGEPGTAANSLKNAWNALFVGVVSSLSFALVPFKVARPPGQCVLLPGQSGRINFPRWWFERHLMISIVGASAVFLPVAGWALWLSYSAIKLLLFALYLLWVICSCISVAFWRMSSRTQGVDWLQFGVCLTLQVSLVSVTDLFLNVYSPAACLVLMGMAFVLPWALYQQGIKRWLRMDYGT